MSLLECGLSINSAVNDLRLNIMLNTSYKIISTTWLIGNFLDRSTVFEKFYTKMLYLFFELFEQANHNFLLSVTIRPFTHRPSHLRTAYLSVSLPINLFMYRIILNNITLEHLNWFYFSKFLG